MTCMELNIKGPCMYMFLSDFTWYREKPFRMSQNEIWVVSPRDDWILLLNRVGAVRDASHVDRVLVLSRSCV